MPHTISAIVPGNHADKNSDGLTLISFDPEIVGNTPMVFLQPFGNQEGASVAYVPSVHSFQHGKEGSRVLIDDKNTSPNYFLNVLVVKPQSPDIHGLKTATSQTPKTGPGLLNIPGIQIDSEMPPQVNILTGYGRAAQSSARAIEIVQSVRPGSDFTNVLTSSGSGDAGYWVNNASAVIQSIPHAAQSGIAAKTGPVTRVEFPAAWDNPPIVFVTPIAAENPHAISHIETVTKVRKTYFESYSNNKGSDLSVQWLAVTSNPNFHKEHVETGIKHFLHHFPEFTDDVNQNRAALENEIVNGIPAPSTINRMRSNTAMHDPYTAEFNGSQFALDLASLVLDGLGLFLTCLGAKEAYDAANANRTAVVGAVATVIEDAPANEKTGLINGLSDVSEELEEAKEIGGAAIAKVQGRTILFLLGSVFGAGLIKVILTKIYLSMDRWQFIVLCVKLGAQLLVIAASFVAGIAVSAGTAAFLEVVAWIGRIAALIMDTAQIGIDIYNLITHLSGQSPQQT